MATFKVILLARWDSKTGEVSQLAESSGSGSAPDDEVDMTGGVEDGDEE